MKIQLLLPLLIFTFCVSFAGATETYVITETRALSKYEDGVMTFWDKPDSGTFAVLKCNDELHGNVFEVQHKVGARVETIQTNEFDDYGMCLLVMVCARNGGPDQYSPIYIWIDEKTHKVISTQLPQDRCPVIDQ